MPRRPGRFAGAFSLLELLVTIGVIGVLLSIVLPALRGARSAARQTACIVNLRGVGVTMETHLRISRGLYPFAAPGARLRMSPPDEEAAYLTTGDHWNLRSSWPALLHDAAPWRENFATWICPGADRPAERPWAASEGGGAAALPSYSYSNSFIAKPRVWMPGATADPSLLQPVSAAEVERPAVKAIMYDEEMAHLSLDRAPRPDSIPILFADGHASTHPISDIASPVVNPFTGIALPLHDTGGGVTGRDF